MSKTIHTHCLKIASELSSPLFEAISRVGSLTLQANDSHTLADTLCRSVAGQQLSVKAAQTIWQRVESARCQAPMQSFLLSCQTEQLRTCGLSAAKSKAVKGIAEAAQNGELDDNALRLMTAQERAQHLTRLWGVGQWTADMINIFYYAEPDIWPEKDVTVRNTLIRLTDEKSEAIDLAHRFSPYRSYLALYLYQVADAKPQTAD